MNKKTEPSGSPCSLLRRLAIIVYDGIVVISLLMLATMLAMLAGFGGRTAMKDPIYTGYLLAVWFIYLAWCWHKGGMTVGMRAWRVKIEDRDGHRPGWGMSALRFLVSLVSAALA
ncbi:MAG: RDD family protein, partial [Xanthomonadales bacterium]|nr:RDD family protein [Xanthomonadales bacterium]